MRVRHAVRLLFFISTILLISQQARSEDGGFSGQWEQTCSNAGSCEKCRIAIIRHGRFMRISANYGWSATAETGSYGNVGYAAGMGRWSSYMEKYSQKAFHILLAVRGDKLTVIMMTEKANGSNQLIRALFSRRTAYPPYDRAQQTTTKPHPPVACPAHLRRNLPV